MGYPTLIRSPRDASAARTPSRDAPASSHPLPRVAAGAQPAPRALALTLLDAASITVFVALVAALGRRLLEAPWSVQAALLATACAIAGYALADVMSGVIHWVGDTFFAEDTPIIGTAFIHPFREHHRDPLAITRHGFLEVNGNNCLALVPLLLPTWLLGAPDGADDHVPWLGIQVTVLFFSLATFGTNQFHKWAHQPGPPPRAVRWLRRARLILEPGHHDVHHRAPHRQSYCVTVGWLNPALDAAGIFDLAERAIRRLARLGRPRDGSRPGSGPQHSIRPAR